MATRSRLHRAASSTATAFLQKNALIYYIFVPLACNACVYSIYVSFVCFRCSASFARGIVQPLVNVDWVVFCCVRLLDLCSHSGEWKLKPHTLFAGWNWFCKFGARKTNAFEYEALCSNSDRGIGY